MANIKASELEKDKLVEGNELIVSTDGDGKTRNILSNDLAEFAAKKAETNIAPSIKANSDKIEEISSQNAQLAAKDEELAAKDAELEAKNAELVAKNAEIEAKHTEIVAKKIKTFNIFEKTIYYAVNENEEQALYKIKTNGKGEQKIVDLKSANVFICITGDWIYYTDKVEDSPYYYTIYRIKTNGKDKERVNI